MGKAQPTRNTGAAEWQQLGEVQARRQSRRLPARASRGDRARESRGEPTGSTSPPGRGAYPLDQPARSSHRPLSKPYPPTYTATPAAPAHTTQAHMQAGGGASAGMAGGQDMCRWYQGSGEVLGARDGIRGQGWYQGSAVPGGNARRQRRPSMTRKKGWEGGRASRQEGGAQPSAAKSASRVQKYLQAQREAVRGKAEGSFGSGARPWRPGTGGGGSAKWPPPPPGCRKPSRVS